MARKASGKPFSPPAVQEAGSRARASGKTIIAALRLSASGWHSRLFPRAEARPGLCWAPTPGQPGSASGVKWTGAGEPCGGLTHRVG